MRKFIMAIALTFASCSAGSPVYASVPSDVITVTNMAKAICPKVTTAALESGNVDATIKRLSELMDKLNLTKEQRLMLLGMCIEYQQGFADGVQYKESI